MHANQAFSAQHIVPTDEQLLIQTSDARSIIVQANAGAAKTTSLALRIAEGLARGLSPSSILALTYTEPACDALRAALRKIGVSADITKKVWISSFERFSIYCLKAKEGSAVLSVNDADAIKPYVWNAIERLSSTANERTLDHILIPSRGDSEVVERFWRESLRIKGTLARDQAIWEEQSITPELADELGLDFTQLSILGSHEMLRCPAQHDLPVFRAPFDACYDLARWVADPQRPDWIDALPNWPRHIAALMLDEMHDLNRAMFELVRALLASNPSSYFCGVGDVDQVIHANAGANSQYMQRTTFEQETGRRVITLPLSASYRFSPELATLAGRLAQKPYAANATHPTTISSLRYGSKTECVQHIVQAALSWKASKRRMAEFAVLLRSPSQSVLLENALLEADLPYTTRGFGSYLQRPEVLLVRAVLAIATADFESVQSQATRQRMVEELVSFCRVELDFSNHPGETQRERIQEAVRHVALEPTSLTAFFEFQLLRNTDEPSAARLRSAIHAAKYSCGPQMFDELLAALDMPVWANQQWVQKQRRAEAVANLEGLRAAAQVFGSAAEFLRHLNATELRLEALNQRSTRVAESKSLCLADITAVKGLEFENVVLPFLQQGDFPNRERDIIGDERNLFYVGITRARRSLTLISSMHKPSQFMAELGLL